MRLKALLAWENVNMAKVKKGYGIMTMKIRGQFPTNVTAIVFQKHYCEFHYSDYAQTNPDEVVKSFYTLVDEAVQNTKPLLCIGFYLPMEVNLRKNEFKDEFIFPMLPSLKKHILPRC